MNIYYERINNLIIDLLVPVRTQKRINKEIFDEFYSILEEIKEEIEGKENISRKIVGLLFFIYCSLSSEVANGDYKSELFMSVAKIESILFEIFGSL